MDKKTKIISSITAGGLFISAMLVSFSPVEAAISNGDLVQVKLNGGAWTNGNIQDNFTGTGDNIGIGGNNGSTQVPAVEVANQQAMNGYGPGDYIFTQATEIPGNGANPVWIQHFLGNYGFVLEDKSQPSSKPIYGYYAGSDVYTLSGWYAQPNPYSNPYWYAPGQYVHLAPYAKPYVRIDSVQNGQSLVPGSTVTVADTNNDPSDDGTGNPDKVPGSGTPSGLIAVWYFNNMGTYVNADVGHSNEQVATYGFTPWQDTYIPAIAPTRSFQITVPSGASGSGMLYLYYVDGIDRYYEASYAVNTAAPASPPSVTITANPTSLPAGKGSVVTATGKNVPANDYIELKDVSGLDTIAGENTYSDGVYGETSLSQTVYSSTPETAKYEALVINGNTGHVDATSGTVSVTWTSSGNTGGTNGNGGNGPTITLSASPTSLATGKYTGVTAIASGNTSGDFIELSDISGADTFDGSNTFEDGVVGETGLSGPAVSQTPQTVTYQASIIDALTGQTVAISNQVQVTWGQNATITLTANPTNLTTGQPSTLTATASNAPSPMDEIKIIDESGKSTLGGQNSYVAMGNSASTQASATAPETVQYEAELLSPMGTVIATSNTVSVTWAGAIGCPSQLAIIDQGGVTSNSDTITIVNQTPDVLQVSTNSPPITLSQTSTTAGMDVTITATFSGGVNTGTLTITDASTGCQQTYTIYDSSYTPPASNNVTLTANPTTLGIGGATTLAATVDTVQQGAFVDIYDETTRQFVGMGTYEYGYSMPPYWTATMTGMTVQNGVGVVQYSGTYTMQYSSNVAGPQTFVAYVWAPGVSPQGPPTEESSPITVTWTKPTITLSASPTNVFTGQASNISYSTVGWSSGDYVTISGQGGQHMWSQTDDTNQNDSYSETESPTGGNSVTVSYTANLYNSAGTLLSTATVTVKWTSPTITITANPSNNVPGESSQISYSVNVPLPAGYTVQITPSGNGADMWNTTGLTGQNGTYTETESPTSGQTITVNYTATVLDLKGNPVATGGTTVTWSNPWTGTITLTASPKYVPTGQSTTLTATTSQPIPTGWSLVIMDETTGQTVLTSGVSPEIAQYTSFNAETDTFVAWISDGYGQIGAPSNQQTVTWIGLYLAANPTELSAGQSTTLSVIAQDVPSGDYVVVFNSSTGQVVGISQSNQFTVNVMEPIPQTDTFQAFVSSDGTTDGTLMSSNTVQVDWFGVTLQANPVRLPTDQWSTLTATAQDVANDYYLMIVDQTTGQVIAIGNPGQTTLQAEQSMVTAQTHTYVAEVARYSGGGNVTGDSGGSGSSNEVAVLGASGAAWNNGEFDLQAIAKSGGTYQVFTNPTQVKLNRFNTVLIEADEPTSFYDELETVIPQLNAWVAQGGHLVIYAADRGWQAGAWPGGQGPVGLTFTWNPTDTDDVVLPNTPFTEGLPNTIPGNYASHDDIVGLPNNAVVYITDSTDGAPVAASFTYGKGEVFVSTQTIEWGAENGNSPSEGNEDQNIMDTFVGGGLPNQVMASSPPVSVTWYNYDLSLTANPTTLPAGQATTLTAISTTGGGTGDVIEIYDETTGQVVGTSTANASSYSATWTESAPTTDTFIAWFVNPSGGHDQASNTVQVTWNQVKLTLSDAEVYHTPAWQQNLENYNNYYTNIDPQPQLVRSESDFWAGEDLLFKVHPSITDIAQAYVYLPAISMNPMMPPGSPINWTSPPPIALTYNSSDGCLEGGIPTAWDEWLQYMQDGTYTVTFWVKSTDNQVATAQASFTIRDTWVSGNDPGTYFHEHQTW
ncbi:hypothetical protein URH17368_0002 [Alicyclobacillus hesperidum URH17-3-68]|uniref:beta strand repeat-containing protein n=1 Tax=Alicyclobacillus hesperidum TaxID=89784 RepID=UPI000281AFB3|nr:hypothetical protein [Alicyclobacillus hesperidum]EJY57279.1 hypothetical protein URH17368_0002 [Alicyclobacillus hesperidum URH17-3-68]